MCSVYVRCVYEYDGCTEACLSLYYVWMCGMFEYEVHMGVECLLVGVFMGECACTCAWTCKCRKQDILGDFVDVVGLRAP